MSKISFLITSILLLFFCWCSVHIASYFLFGDFYAINGFIKGFNIINIFVFLSFIICFVIPNNYLLSKAIEEKRCVRK